MPAPERLRVLALHSFRTSAEIFREQMRRSGLDQKLEHLVDIVYVDAPHEATGPAPADVSPFFGPPYREWWTARDDPETGAAVYEGIDRTLAYLTEVLRQQGPFDGCWAFSQGTLVSTLLIALQRQGQLFQEHPPLRFAVLFGGFFHRERSQQVPLLARALPPGLQLPVASAHVIGDRDFVKQRSHELMSLYQAPLLITHPRGHAIPALAPDGLQALSTFLEQQITAKRRDRAGAPEPPDVSRL